MSLPPSIRSDSTPPPSTPPPSTPPPSKRLASKRSAAAQPTGTRAAFKALLPGSAISIAVHAIIIVLASISIRGCEQGVPVKAGGAEFHEIGLAMVNDTADNNTEMPAANPSDSDTERPAEPDAEDLQPDDAIPTEVPSVDELLNPSTSPADSPTEPSILDIADIIGNGPSMAEAASAPPKQSQQKAAGTSGRTTAGSPTPGPGETAFMDIVGSGESFVYLIDVSSSMKENQNRKLNLARSQLMGSLRHLKMNQSFQVFFYSNSVEGLRLGQKDSEHLYRATTANLELAERFISSITAKGGTEHKLALTRAVRLGPDVIYFLTDGAGSKLMPFELAKIHQQNKSRAQIHVVEFASGSLDSLSTTWLHKLAQQSGGKYRRIQVK